MTDNVDLTAEQLPLHGVGEQLRLAREEKGMTVAQVAAETRIPQRHLELIEAGNFNALPARTYAVGFSRSYARLVGLDEKRIAAEVRAELAQNDPAYRHRAATFEPGDPARVPSRALAVFSAFAAVVLLVGVFVFYQTYFSPAAGPGPITAETVAARPAAPQPGAAQQPAAAGGPVVFTALEDGVWVKFYDAAGAQLMQKEMSKGETYTVPADAKDPQVWTGRPYALAITVGGKPVPKLSEQDEIIRNVPVTAEALLARGDTPPAPAASPTAGT
ncbi:MAG: helix-turn-helix domain-containing protein [Tsuneonella sp.]